MVDDVGVLDHAWVGSHEAVYVGPDFKDAGVEGGGENGGGVVAAAAAEVGDVAVGIGGDESGDDGHFERSVVECCVDEFLRGVVVEDVLAELVEGLDEIAGVEELCVADDACDDCA